ncbi:Protein TORNADO 1 [Acorus calamus]|uniref:Protein TORNADO 1 n=1 Tax=Acorus calamus TaxID=4465 RepID=A0AAV9CVE8_ACOCL|nr:Protein TORNADO 1 [Acorus calamus]
MLKRNEGIKELTFSECGIGFLGAELLASALKMNESVEELQIWEDSIGSRGAEELSKMIEANPNLKLLIILDSHPITVSPLVSAVLSRNRSMEVHIWSRDNRGERISKSVELTPENDTLRVYRIDSSGSRRLASALVWNSTIVKLDMTGVRLRSRWAKEFRGAIEHNRSLKHVNLSKTGLKDKSAVYIAAGLFKNCCLEELKLEGNRFGGIGIEHVLCPLSKFFAVQSQANVSLKCITFGGDKAKIGRYGFNAILRLVETNETVVQLGIHDDSSLKSNNMIRIFKSLEKNTTLKYLSLRGCNGIEGDLLLRTILETLEVNPWIEEIELTGTPMEKAGKTEAIYQKLGSHGRLELEQDSINDMEMAAPKTCRIFLCGQELQQNFSSSKLPYFDMIRTLPNPIEQIIRTVGIKIRTFHHDDTKISVWDLDGQQGFHAFHDLIFPGHGSPSFFLIITSLFKKPDHGEKKSPSEIEEEILYWLRFIVSNTKRALSQTILPSISVVFTHFDKITEPVKNMSPYVNSIQRLRERFLGFVEFHPTVFTVDARSSGSVSKLSHHIRKTSNSVIQRVPQVYEVCNELIQILTDWKSTNHKPLMKWNEFSQLCQIKIPSLRVRSRHNNLEKVEMKRRAVATSLHRMGDVIFFDELGILVLDCEWFCGEVLGRITMLENKRQASMGKNGFLSRQELEKILKESLQNHILRIGSKVFENLEATDLVKMMLKLELCYEQEPWNPDSLLLVPAILEENKGKLVKWQLSGQECSHVHLHNKIFASIQQHSATYSLEKNHISITMNGIHIRVELGIQPGHSIDILACSTKNISEILKLFKHLIIPTIQGLCHGITLKETIIRSECIKELTPARYRKAQSVPVQQLKQALLSVPADSMYDYQHAWNSASEKGKVVLQPGFEFARNLLSDDEFREVLHRRCYDLYHLATELEVPFENTQHPPPLAENETDRRVESSLTGIAQGVESILQRLRIIEREIKDLKLEIQGLRYYEHTLLAQLHRKMDYLLNFNIQVEERKVPNMFYFVQVGNQSKRLVTRLISGMTMLRLHMLCEFRGEIHVVEDQMGCELTQVDNRVIQYVVPYISKFMKLLTFALKIGAHFAAGMGELIPDLSKEVAHLFDSSLIYGAAAMATGAIGATAIGQVGQIRNRGRSRSLEGGQRSWNAQQDVGLAQQWLIDFLKDQKISSGKEVADKFGLWRVRYTDDGRIAWVCQRHRVTRASELIELPI